MKFLTEEWFNEFKSEVLETFSAGKTPSSATLSLCECYNKVPHEGNETVWLMYSFKNGVLCSLERGTGRSSAPEADYISDADYDIFVKTVTGELAIAKALFAGKIKLKGNVTKALKLLSTHDIVSKCKFLDGKTEW